MIETDALASPETTTDETGREGLDAMGRLAAGVAHDFNDKLTVILGRASQLIGQLPGEGEDSQLAEVVEATEELRGVWSDFTHDEWHRFIDFLSRFESGLRRVRG